MTGAPVATLDALVAKSLVQVRHQRVTQLEVVRQFAAAELARTPDADAVRRRHAEHYLALAERLGPQVRVAGRGPALDEMERELGNLAPRSTTGSPVVTATGRCGSPPRSSRTGRRPAGSATAPR